MIERRQHIPKRWQRLLVVAALAIVLAACSGDSGDAAGEAGPTSSAPSEPTETREASEDSASVQPEATEPEHELTPDEAVSCDVDPEVMNTADGVDFVRTPGACFEDLPDWPYEADYVEIDGLRQAYVDEGPADGEVVLLLHGQPSWSYLYRDMIPVLADAGYRVIAMDHLGMGRSDKPIELDAYSYLGHNDRLEGFIDELALTDINVFVQDWGSLIGLRIAGLNPDLFATITVGDGTLPVIPEGIEPFPPVENPDLVADIESVFGTIPEQQVPFYDGCEPLLDGSGDFGAWIRYSMTAESFHASEVVEAMTWFDLSPEEEAAYDAPFPSRIYMGGPRTFPSLVNELPGQTAEAWAGLTEYEKPVLTIWAGNDPGNLGQCATQQRLIDEIPGADGQPHDRLDEASHFLQDDQGEEIARRMVDWWDAMAESFPAADPTSATNAPCWSPAEMLEPGQTSDAGFEILDRREDGTLVVWLSLSITLEEFDALELPPNWIKNQPRGDGEGGEGGAGPDEGMFCGSPGSTDGEMVISEHFGHEWAHVATIVEVGVPVDDEGLLLGTRVAKEHEITYYAGSTVPVLISPDGEIFPLVSRDAQRTTDESPIPTGWTVVEHTFTEDYTTRMPNPILNIRVENQDSYQGPVTGLEIEP